MIPLRTLPLFAFVTLLVMLALAPPAHAYLDPGTGSIALRAEIPNPKRLLLPGMYVRVRLPQAIADDAITVPQRALVRTQQGAVVMVVGADGKVTPQPVTTTAAQGDVWVIGNGLKGGEKIIVEGLQKAKPGSTVKPVPFTGDAGAAASGAAAPAAGK